MLGESKADTATGLLITWRDACTYSGWRDAKAAKSETVPAQCESVGWLLENSKEQVTIFATKAHDPEDTDINSVISIPASWVTKMEVLKTSKGAKIPVFFAGEVSGANKRGNRRRQLRAKVELGRFVSGRLG